MLNKIKLYFNIKDFKKRIYNDFEYWLNVYFEDFHNYNYEELFEELFYVLKDKKLMYFFFGNIIGYIFENKNYFHINNIEECYNVIFKCFNYYLKSIKFISPN